MTKQEMVELSELIKEIEHGDDQIEPMYSLYIKIKRIIQKNNPELLKIKH
jgi:hypothetical protein